MRSRTSRGAGQPVLLRTATALASVTLAVAGVGLLAPAANAAGQPQQTTVQGPIVIQETETCIVGSSGTCTTGPVSANAQGWVRYVVNNTSSILNGCSWRVRDIVSRSVVRGSRVGPLGFTSNRITGLTREYQLELFSCPAGALGTLRNT